MLKTVIRQWRKELISWKINGDSHLNYGIKQIDENIAKVVHKPKKKRNIQLENNNFKTEKPKQPPPPRIV